METKNLRQNTLSTFYSSIGAGVVAGASGIVVGHPFDTMKTRVQVGKLNAGNMSLRSLYRGLLPPLLTTGVTQAVNFTLYEMFRKRLMQYFNAKGASSSGTISFDRAIASQDSSYRTTYLWSVFLGGSGSGAVIAFVSSPSGLLKVRQQVATTASLWQCSKDLFAAKGLKGFYRAFSCSFIMESFGRGSYLWSYEWTKMLLHDWSEGRYSEQSMSVRLAAASFAGCFSWFIVYPLDVMKSRLQLDIDGTVYKNLWTCTRLSWREGGLRTMYRGIGFTMIRAAPVAGTILPIYEFTKDRLDGLMFGW